MLKGSHAGEVKMDLVGKKIGSLTVTGKFRREHVNGGTKIAFLCVCDCGHQAYYWREALRKRKVNYCDACRPLGIRHSKLYHVYHGIKQRCYNPKSPGFDIYGGKGVRMCDEWLESYDAFKAWALSNGYQEGLTIDRIDSNGNYCPENCQWVTISVNTARSNYGRQQNFSKLQDMYAILPDGTKETIVNIKKFARDHDMNAPCVYACLHGRMPPNYQGYIFHSNKSRQESVTTIENTSEEKAS